MKKRLYKTLVVFVLVAILLTASGWSGCSMRKLTLFQLEGTKAGAGEEKCECECNHQDCNRNCKCVPDCDGCNCEKEGVGGDKGNGRSPTY